MDRGRVVGDDQVVLDRRVRDVDVKIDAVVGGREQGFRGYGAKTKYQPGSWKVQIETTDAREIGRIYFKLESAAAAPQRTFVIEID